MDDDLQHARHDDDEEDELDIIPPKKKKLGSDLDADLDEHVDGDEPLSADDLADEEEEEGLLSDSYDDVEPEDLW